MTEAIVNTKYKRRPLMALILSFIMPGLGQIYCGKIVRGLVLAFLSGIFIPIIMVTTTLDYTTVKITIIGMCFFASLVIGLIAAIDSWYLAKHTKADYELKDYNRWYVYVLLVLMSMGSSIDIAFNVKKNYTEAFRVPSPSMYPTIVPDDRILANKTAYKTGAPQRGDIIVFTPPDNRQINNIKRIVAIEGDRVEMKNNELYINGVKLERQEVLPSVLDKIKIKVGGETLKGQVFYEINGQARYKIILADIKNEKGRSVADFAETMVPKGHYFCLGDNRNLSHDSRNYGYVPLADIKGRVNYLYCPSMDWSRFGRINQ